ncbi:hypothetical protein CP982_18165 [Streptomyces spectabilis]|uniref:Uncharacterized protein n=1 Tax=Streptomyces spectabilis TaxID=68270 RepID=A0A5P2X7G5_STRST|nr:hypothetical protein CP982_18165 [Streptomyces spectabilis]
MDPLFGAPRLVLKRRTGWVFQPLRRLRSGGLGAEPPGREGAGQGRAARAPPAPTHEQDTPP